jgi:hypothetical protein
MPPFIMHITWVFISYGIPFLGGYIVGRLKRCRVATTLSRIYWCLIAISGSLIVRYFSFYLFSMVMAGDSETSKNEMPLNIIGLLWGMLIFCIIASIQTVPLVILGCYTGGLFKSIPSKHSNDAE